MKTINIFAHTRAYRFAHQRFYNYLTLEEARDLIKREWQIQLRYKTQPDDETFTTTEKLNAILFIYRETAEAVAKKFADENWEQFV